MCSAVRTFAEAISLYRKGLQATRSPFLLDFRQKEDFVGTLYAPTFVHA